MFDYNYVLEFERFICNKLKNKTSILIKNDNPYLLYDYKTRKLVKGLNQIKLMENNFLFNPIKLTDTIYYRKKISKKIILLAEYKNNKKIYYYVTESKELSKAAENKIKSSFSLTKIEDILEYYFTCCKNQTPYNPFFSDEEIYSFYKFIENNPYELSKKIKMIFEKVTGVK